MSVTTAVPRHPQSAGAAAQVSAERVGVIGLGIMGSAMSANLVKAGFDVCGYDPVDLARERLRHDGGSPTVDAFGTIRRARYLLLSLPSVDALEVVTAQIVEAGQAGLIVSETSTLPVEAKEHARQALQERGIAMLDCPLSGTGAQAVQRDLAVYASGDAAVIASFQPVFDGFARVTYVVGAFGLGMQMKLMANLLVSIHNVAAAEALLMGARMGIDLDTAVKVLADGAGGSRMLQVRGPMMSARTWDQATMKVSTWQKDIKLIANALEAANVPAPLFNAAIPVYNAAMGMGHGNCDTASVYDVLERMSSCQTS